MKISHPWAIAPLDLPWIRPYSQDRKDTNFFKTNKNGLHYNKQKIWHTEHIEGKKIIWLFSGFPEDVHLAGNKE